MIPEDKERDRVRNTVDKNVIDILGLFDNRAYYYGEEILNFTVGLLNDHDDGWHDDVLDDGTVIQWGIRNSACDASAAMKGYWDFRTNHLVEHPPHGVLGSRCSAATIAGARLASLEGVPQISPDSVALQLSDKEEFPFFSRMVSPHEPSALKAMLRGFGWEKVGILQTDTPYNNDVSTRFQQQWTGRHDDASGKWFGEIAFTSTVLLNHDMTVKEDSIRKALDGIPASNPALNSRVILLLMHDQHAYPTIRIAQETNFQPDTVWIGNAGWANKDLQGHEWVPQLPGYIGITPFQNRNQDYFDFVRRINGARTRDGKIPWPDIPDYPGEYLVDAILALTMALSDTAPHNRRNGTAVMERILQLEFDGITGRVSFTEEGDRKDPRWSILNYKHGEWVHVGNVTMDPGTANIDFTSTCFAQYGCGQPPPDTDPVPPNHTLRYVVSALGAVGFLLWVALLGHYITIRNKRKIESDMTQMQKKIKAMANIDNELLDIDQALEETKQRQVSLFKKRAAMQDTPQTWSDSLQTLVPVPPENGQYWAVLNEIRATMPDAHISKLWRIQNLSLWSYYSFHKYRLENNKINANERRVWHGTGTLDPAVIYNDEMDGFMTQFAAHGLWGRGIYFADKASYSKSFSHKPTPPPSSSSSSSSSWLGYYNERPKAEIGELEMFLARLLVGKEAMLSPNRSLTIPPIYQRNGRKYNTVTGITNGSQVWVVYENGRAYPEYLVRYYCGVRDDKRSPYESIDEARKNTDWEESVFDLTQGESAVDTRHGDRNGRWEFMSDSGWVAYNEMHHKMIENKYINFRDNKSHSPIVTIKGPEWEYEVNVDTMIQTNIQHQHHRQRKIRFNPLSIYSQPRVTKTLNIATNP